MTNKRNTGVIAGNFDVIHPGYIHLFNQCKEHCKKLLIFLHEDPSIEREHKLKPILTLDERVLILSSLSQVDEIISYRTERELLKLLKTIMFSFFLNILIGLIELALFLSSSFVL